MTLREPQRAAGKRRGRGRRAPRRAPTARRRARRGAAGERRAAPQLLEELGCRSFQADAVDGKPMMEMVAGSGRWFQAQVVAEAPAELEVLFPCARPALYSREQQGCTQRVAEAGRGWEAVRRVRWQRLPVRACVSWEGRPVRVCDWGGLLCARVMFRPQTCESMEVVSGLFLYMGGCCQRAAWSGAERMQRHPCRGAGLRPGARHAARLLPRVVAGVHAAAASWGKLGRSVCSPPQQRAAPDQGCRARAATRKGAAATQEWVDRRSSRFWRGSLDNAVWKYLGAGAWAPRKRPKPGGRPRAAPPARSRTRLAGPRGAALHLDGAGRARASLPCGR